MYSKRLTDNVYLKQYIHNDYYKNAVFDSKIIDNFLSESELAIFESAAASDAVYYECDTSMKNLASEKLNADDLITAHYYIFDSFYDKPNWKPLVDILQPKLESVFGSNVKASHIHVLESCTPYGLHNDAEQANMIIAPKPAWTLIIPFADYNSKTYVFNERSGYKDPWEWIRTNNIQPSDTYSIDEATYMRDFYPLTEYEVFKYLTVESVFNWQRGSCFAADRFKYHCSDNYLNHGVASKKAIIVWTSIV